MTMGDAFWTAGSPPLDGRLRLLVVGALTILAAVGLWPEAILALETCPTGFLEPTGLMTLLPYGPSDGVRGAADLARLKGPVFVALGAGALGFGGRWPLLLGGLGVLFATGLQQSATGTGHAWYLPSYTLVTLGLLSRPDRWSVDAMLGARFASYPFRVDGRPRNVLDSGLARQIVLLFSVFMLASAGVAKVLESGFGWADGTTLQTYLDLVGDPKPWARPLYDAMRESRALCAAASVFTLLLELGAPAAIFVPRLRLPLVILACGFHVVIQGLMIPKYLPQMICYGLIVDWGAVFSKAGSARKAAKPAPMTSATARVVGTAVSALLLFVAFVRIEAYPLSYVPMYSTRVGPNVRAGYPNEAWETPEGLRRIGATFDRTGRPWLVKYALGKSLRFFVVPAGAPPTAQGRELTQVLLRKVFRGNLTLYYARLSGAAAKDLAATPPGSLAPPDGALAHFVETAAQSLPPIPPGIEIRVRGPAGEIARIPGKRLLTSRPRGDARRAKGTN